MDKLYEGKRKSLDIVSQDGKSFFCYLLCPSSIRNRECLDNGNLQKAVKLVENFPNGGNRQENAKRARAMIEGYRAITKNYQKLIKEPEEYRYDPLADL